MYLAQNIKDIKLFLISPDCKYESSTYDYTEAYKWKSLAACKVWCSGCGAGNWIPIKVSKIRK